MTQSFTYHHTRSGDLYQVHVLDGNFSIAFRHVDHLGSDPIVYEELQDLPDGARHEVEQRIEELRK